MPTQIFQQPIQRLAAAIVFLISLFFFFISSLATTAQAQTFIPSSPKLRATAWILIDANSGKVLAEQDSDKPLPPASLTKMMTSYLVEKEISQGNLSQNDQVRVSIKAWKMGGSKMFIRESTYVSVSDLLKGVIIQSGNDASVALAEHLAGDENGFAQLMNSQAKLLGMNNTHFKNSTGLPHPEHYSTARDLALLSQAKIINYPDHYSLYSQKEFTYNNITQPNRNRLLWRDPSVDGLKTGHTEEAGYCLAASAQREGMRLIAVVLGAATEESRAQETQKLLNYGFRFYETTRLFRKHVTLQTNEVWQGMTNQVAIGLQEDLIATLAKGDVQKIKVAYNLPSNLKAPIKAGSTLGTLEIKIDNQVIDSRPLIALETVEKAGFLKHIWHSLLMFFTNLFS